MQEQLSTIYVPAWIRDAAISEVDVTGSLIDVDAVDKVEGNAIGSCGEHLGLSAVGPDLHEPLVGVGDVEVAGLVVEGEPSGRPHRLSVSSDGATGTVHSGSFL
jgi:hypothetical protein